jgi:hypothetical protein
VEDKVSSQHISLQILHFSSQYHSTAAPFSFVHLPPVQYNLGTTQLPGQHSCVTDSVTVLSSALPISNKWWLLNPLNQLPMHRK